MEIILSCSPGLEGLLKEEILELCPELSEDKLVSHHGALYCELREQDLQQIYLFSRLGSRMHLTLRNFAAHTPAMLYDQVRRVNWTDYFGVHQTFQVQTRGKSDAFEMPFATLKIKDAVCDEFRKLTPMQERPNVSKENPDFTITAFFEPTSGRCVLSLDLTRDVLHRRGYRKVAGKAPLRENKAAALVRLANKHLSESDKPDFIVDPFCGSGTILFEFILNHFKAPRMLRLEARDPIFKVFPKLESPSRSQHALAWNTYQAQVTKNSLPPIIGRDWDEFQLDGARENAKILGLERLIRFEKGDALEFSKTNCLFFGNPPFGERLGDAEKTKELLHNWGRKIKFEMSPATIALALARTGLSKHLGFRPDLKLQVENGPVPLELCICKVYSGSVGNSKRG